jgi:hypothetical protein
MLRVQLNILLENAITVTIIVEYVNFFNLIVTGQPYLAYAISALGFSVMSPVNM